MQRLLRSALLASLLVSPMASLGAAQGYICAEGGGNEANGNWAPSVFGWMVEKGGFGDVVVLGVSGADVGVANAFLAAGAASATNLAVNSATADLQSTYDAIAAADIVWMRGGDQFQYVSQWNGTLTEQAIRDVYLAGGVVGGTSAGCAVLGEVVYDAAVGSLTPKQALQDAHHPFLTLRDDFLELTPDVLFDTHFTERGRLARLAVMLGRWYDGAGEDVLGVGVDDRTALCVSPDLTAEVRGEGAVTLLHRTADTLSTLKPGEPPVLTDLAHTQLTEGYVVDLVSRTVLARPGHAVLHGPPTADPSFAPTSLSGSSPADSPKGEVALGFGGDPDALFLGSLEIVPGNGTLARTVLSLTTWNSFDFDEVLTGGPQLALHENPHFLALYLDGGTTVDVLDASRLRVMPATSASESSAVVLDGHGMVSSARSTYFSGAGSVDTRASVALEGAALHLLREGMVYDAAEHAVEPDYPYGAGTPGCDGPHTLTTSAPPRLGSSFELLCDNAPPSSLGLVFVGFDSDLAGTDLFGAGLAVHVAFFPLAPVNLAMPSDAAGDGSVTIPLGNSPALAGATFYAQALWAWPSTNCTPSTLGLSSSRGMGLTVFE